MAASNAGAGIESSNAGESLTGTQMQIAGEKFLTELKLRTDIDQKEKERIADFITSVITGGTRLAGTAILAGK